MSPYPDNGSSIQKQEIADQKRQLRCTSRRIRNKLGKAARQQASLSICTWIESWPIFQQSFVILTYMPIPGEVDLTTLLVRQPQKQWVIPRIIPEENHRMVLHRYEAGRLTHHPFGMDEPSPDSPVVPASEVQVALVPGLTFDRHGMRLGYGGGYFDRFLRDFQGISVGVVFRDLLLNQLPCGNLDMPVNWIVTEEGFCQPDQQG
jgi:5-formyltetrahydrofolate cyclo-ligase